MKVFKQSRLILSHLRQFFSEEQKAENNKFCEEGVFRILCKVRGYNAKNRNCISYPNLPSAIRTVPQGPDVPIPSPPEAWAHDSGFEIEHKNSPQQFTQCELNDLVRDLGVFKVGAETLGSRLQSKHMFAPGTAVSIDISGLMFQLGAEKQKAKEYSAKKSLKGEAPIQWELLFFCSTSSCCPKGDV
ncbi:hypothetical protein T06_15067 [Trichinella sp. T6]|nr:hypothetical protein T06_15067 [Trichinella sp. T6]